MVLIDTDMIVDPIARPSSIARAPGARWSRSRTTPIATSPQWGELLDLGPPRRQPYVSFALVALGGEVASRGPAPARRPPEPNRLRAHLLASAPNDRLPVALRRPGRAQRDPRHAGGAATASSPSSSASRRCPRFAASRSPTATACAAPTRTESSPRRPSLARQAVARADPPRRLLAAASAPAGRRRGRDPGAARLRSRCGFAAGCAPTPSAAASMRASACATTFANR